MNNLGREQRRIIVQGVIVYRRWFSLKAELLEVFGSDLTVVNAARVSFHKEKSEVDESDKRLLLYLAKHEHISPFFHPQLRFRLTMPIWMAREWFRHTVGFARNEVSRRYVEEEPDIWIPSSVHKRNPGGNKQGRGELHEDSDELVQLMQEHAAVTTFLYNHMLEKGVAPEIARGVLPVNLHTEFIETGSLAAYYRLWKLRNTEGANEEVRAMANEVWEKVSEHFPCSCEALKTYDA